MASSSKLLNGTMTRLFSVAKHEKAGDAKLASNLREALKFAVDKFDMSKWRKVNAVACGIDRSMIPLPSRIVLKVLRDKGHQCFLVGGCVRDLLLKRVPKDFDVITTANLRQIKNQFHKSQIVGQRFPVCVVSIRGQDIEVSSFDTVANTGFVDKSSPRLMPKSCTKTDVLLWRNSMLRDFTINSLFFDPYSARIYDYTGGMTDLKSLELRTLVPAHLSFQEDCARILRGLRIAARLNLSVSHDTASAIHRLSSSVLTLSKFRIMMELNYMLSYGAAQPSLSLLERFTLLQVFFPCQAAILDQQTNEGCALSSTMLMRLFFNLDNMVACDRPGHCSLWISLLAFHLALNTKPQEPLVIWTLSSLLCSKDWSKSVEFARESARRHLFSAPEISESFDCMDDVELANKVSELASLIASSIVSLTREHALLESISRFREPPSSVMVFVSEKCGKETARLFSMFDADIKLYSTGRKRDDIDYQSLKKGEVLETRYVLGRVIMNTMSGKVNEACSNHNQEIFHEQATYKEELVDHNLHLPPSVHATEKAANENKKFSEVWPEPVDGIFEGVEVKNRNTSQQDLDAYFLDELGPARFQEKSEELITVARTCTKENIPKQKVSDILDHGTKRTSKQEAYNSSQKTTVADIIVKQKMVLVEQVIDTLQLQTEINFSDDNLKRDNQTTSKMFWSRQGTPNKEKGDAKKTANESNSRKPLSSFFKIASLATDEKKTSENFRENVYSNISERCLRSAEEVHNVERAGQTKTTGKENMSEKLHLEPESLILGGKHHQAMKKQEVMVISSGVISEKSLEEKNCMHEVHTDEVREAFDGNNHRPSGCVPDQKTATMKRTPIKTRSKSQEKTKTVLMIKNREIFELNVDADIQEVHVDTRSQKIEDDIKALETDHRNTTVKQNLSEKIEPATKTCLKATQESENSLEEIKETFNEEKTCAHTGIREGSAEIAEITDGNGHYPPADNIQHPKTAIKKRKSSKKLCKTKDEMKTEVRVNKHNKVPEQDADADIMEALGEIRFKKGDEDLIETAKTGVTKTASNPKKRRKAAQKQERIAISSEEVHETSLDAKISAHGTNKVDMVETVYDDGRIPPSDHIQDQTTTTNKKRKTRKTRFKSEDEANVQTMQLKTALEFTGDDLQADVNKSHPPSMGNTSCEDN